MRCGLSYCLFHGNLERLKEWLVICGILPPAEVGFGGKTPSMSSVGGNHTVPIPLRNSALTVFIGDKEMEHSLHIIAY